VKLVNAKRTKNLLIVRAFLVIVIIRAVVKRKETWSVAVVESMHAIDSHGL
jgi:hypothetical protein